MALIEGRKLGVWEADGEGEGEGEGLERNERGVEALSIFSSIHTAFLHHVNFTHLAHPHFSD